MFGRSNVPQVLSDNRRKSQIVIDGILPVEVMKFSPNTTNVDGALPASSRLNRVDNDDEEEGDEAFLSKVLDKRSLSLKLLLILKLPRVAAAVILPVIIIMVEVVMMVMMSRSYQCHPDFKF